MARALADDCSCGSGSRGYLCCQHLSHGCDQSVFWRHFNRCSCGKQVRAKKQGGAELALA